MQGNAHQRRVSEREIARVVAEVTSDNKSLESLLPQRISMFSRIQRFIENNSLQTLISITGGLVGTFLDGRYFAVLGVVCVYALWKSKALQGLTRKSQAAWYAAMLCSACAGLYLMGVHLNLAKPHVFTPAENHAAFKAGNPPPIVQQIYQTFEGPTSITRVINEVPKQHTAILFNDPEVFVAAGAPDLVRVSLTERNAGDYLVLGSSFRSAATYGSYDEHSLTPCNTAIFTDFRKGVTFASAGPPLEKGGTLERIMIPSNSKEAGDVLYISAAVKWKDQSGTYETDYFSYIGNGGWHPCGTNNSTTKEA